METTLTLIVLAVIVLILLINIGKKHNKTDWGHAGLNILDGINLWFCRRYHRLPESFIRLPESGPAVLVSNHISGLDPLLLIAATDQPFRFLIAQEEYDRWWLKWLLKWVGCIPVKRDKNPKKALNECLAALKRNEVLVVFPQGGIVTKDDGKPLKKGAFVLARMAAVPICSVCISGVKAQGFTVLSVFIRSRVRIVQNADKRMLTEQNMTKIMSQIKQMFWP